MVPARAAGSSTLRRLIGEQQVLPLYAAFSAVAETIDQKRNTAETLADIAAARHGTYGMRRASATFPTLVDSLQILGIHQVRTV